MKSDRVVDSCLLPSRRFSTPAALHPRAYFRALKHLSRSHTMSTSIDVIGVNHLDHFRFVAHGVSYDRQIRFSIYPSFLLLPVGQPRAYRTCPRFYKMIVFARTALPLLHLLRTRLEAVARKMIEYQDVLVRTVPRGTFSASADYIHFPENSFPLPAAVY